MQMRAPVLLKSAIKALGDVVLPAVDPNNKLAQEQARLVIGLLSLLLQQLPLQFRYDRDELARLLAFSRELERIARGGEGTAAALAALACAVESARAALDGARSDPSELEAAIHTLREATGRVVSQACVDGDPACRDGVGSAVLAMSKQQILRERSAALMQGWEPDPKAIPPLETLI